MSKKYYVYNINDEYWNFKQSKWQRWFKPEECLTESYDDACKIAKMSEYYVVHGI